MYVGEEEKEKTSSQILYIDQINKEVKQFSQQTFFLVLFLLSIESFQ